MAAPGVRFWRAATPMMVLSGKGLTIALLSGILAACGGSATREDGAAPSGGASSAAGAGGSGNSSAGAGGQGSTPAWLTELELDEAFPWFVQSHDGQYGAAPPTEDGVVHVTFEGEPVEVTLSTHNHVGVVDMARAVSFKAKAESPLLLWVSVKESLDADYFGARDAGRLWPVAQVMVETEWQTFDVAFADMMPPEPNGDEAGTPAFTLAFIVDAPSGPVELWLDDVHFE